MVEDGEIRFRLLDTLYHWHFKTGGRWMEFDSLIPNSGLEDIDANISEGHLMVLHRPEGLPDDPSKIINRKRAMSRSETMYKITTNGIGVYEKIMDGVKDDIKIKIVDTSVQKLISDKSNTKQKIYSGLVTLSESTKGLFPILLEKATERLVDNL